MGNRGRVINRLAWVFFLGLLMASSCLAQPPVSPPVPRAAAAVNKPIQDRMKTWRMPHKHPDPAWLNVNDSNWTADSKERVFKFGQDRFGSVWYGRATWRPDPSAQVDELKARLYEEAKAAGWK